ncbi:MAG: sugar phosphate isomerase/epimerase family protein [Phycisphaerales bacterium]
MKHTLTRRGFVKSSVGVLAGAAVAGRVALAEESEADAEPETAPLFKISLAQWSLHRAFFEKKIDNLDFAATAKNEFGIDAIEYVNQFFKDKGEDHTYLAEMKKRTADLGVTNVLIMCDGEGRLGDPDEAARKQAVHNHIKWVEAAKYFDCHSIRVNAASEGGYEEQQKLAADGLRRLCEFADTRAINVLVENHGGLSSNGAWLAGVMKLVDHKRVGTLPDFGNFRIKDGEMYDRYKGVTELMPYAKSVSAKTHDFDDAGNETETDYTRMMKIVLDAGYHGYVGIEYEGSRLSEYEGVARTKALLERLRSELA